MEWLLNHVTSEWQQLKAAPFAFMWLFFLGCFIGIVFAGTLYRSQITLKDAQLADKDAHLARYKVALGIETASQGVLIGLSNEEMRAKAINTAAKLRAFDVASRNVYNDTMKGVSDPHDQAERRQQIEQMRSDEFDRSLKADAINVDTELRRRLGPKALASIVGLPTTFYATANKDAPVGMVTLVASAASGWSSAFVGTLADGIERMAQVLPAK